MPKLLVINPRNHTRIPFLRGMLVKSLQEAGLDFNAAYRAATEIRDGLEHCAEISRDDLRQRIETLLAKEHAGGVLRQYQHKDLYRDIYRDIYRENIKVVREDGSTEAFSRAAHVQRLQRSSIATAQCNAITRKVHSHLVRNKIREISSHALTTFTYATVVREVGQNHADFYLIWRDFLKNSRPLLLLIGGIPGCGKSTVATEIANRLGIVRTQSTDMLREVMRIMIPPKLSPSLHTSSFNAGQVSYIPELYNDPNEHLIYGFQLQSDMVGVACEAVIQRALNERVSMIVEGVHVRPALRAKIQASEAVVVPICLAVLDKARLIKFINGRQVANQQRRAKRYLEHLEPIWQLQTILLAEADHQTIDIIDNKRIIDTAQDIINIIIRTIAATYTQQLPSLRQTYSC